jgi:hypothetical protein
MAGNSNERWCPMRTLLLLGAILGLLMVGCQPNMEPIERTAGKGIDIANQYVSKALAETSTRTSTMQGNLDGIEPGWVFRGYGIFGTGVVYEGQLYAKGVSGGMTLHAQADQGQATTDERPPGERAPAKIQDDEKPAAPAGPPAPG